MSLEPTKIHDIEELNKLYNESETCDKEIFAEQRSNILLVSGEHYQKRQNEFYRRIRDSKQLSEEQKLRLTKNHIQKITKTYVNNIISVAPGVGFEPKNPQELQDQKAAEMHKSVWQDLDQKHRIQTELIDEWADDYIQVGEVAVKIFWDPNKGKIKAYNQAMDEEGNPLFLGPDGNPTPESHSMNQIDQYGQPMAHELAPDQNSPVYEGGFIIDSIQGFNLLRSPEAKSMSESDYLCYRKMADVDVLKKQFADDEKKEKMFNASVDDTMVVFDSNKAGYHKAKNQVMVREFYFRPCPKYPRGYFFFTTKAGVFAEGELPGGIFPIIYRHCERIPTSPRGRSPIKTMRPYQAEINRSASKIAEHQITLGDDKLAIQKGTELSAGTALPGVRGIYYTGMQPTHIPGRDGSQYLDYMNAQIEELYRVMNVAEDSLEKQGQLDPYTLLFRSAHQKKVFQRYIRGFERFLMDVAQTSLALAKIHYSEDMVVQAAGKSEQLNVAEFKNSTDIGYEIKITALSDDIETKLGKQLVLNHVLQYTGQQLDREDIGKLVAQMPYGDVKNGLSDMTMNFESANNIILQLDRGARPPLHPYDDHPYVIRRLVSRTRQADFSYLPQPIQAAYQEQIQAREQAESLRLEQIQRAQAGFIPTDGYMVVCDLYVPDPINPGKTQRAKIPYSSLAWLIKQLELQGKSLEELAQMNEGALAQMAEMQSAGGGVVQPGPRAPLQPDRANQGQGRPFLNTGSPQPGGMNHGPGSLPGSNVGSQSVPGNVGPRGPAGPWAR